MKYICREIYNNIKLNTIETSWYALSSHICHSKIEHIRLFMVRSRISTLIVNTKRFG